MPIDPSIPLGIKLYSFLDDEAKRQQIRQQHYKLKRDQADDARDDEYRTALGDVLTGNGGFAQPMQDGQSPAQAIGAAPSAGPSAAQRAMRADPEAFLKYRGAQLDLTAKQLKGYRDLNDTGMQILGGVHDDASLQAAKAQARQLYQNNGMDTATIDAIPDQYSPELVRDLQMRGMDTAHQLSTVARENKLNWDMADDQEDNDRADRLAGSMIEDRNARREFTRQRVQIAREKAGGGAKPGGAPKNENALFTDIQRRFNTGQPVTDRERQFAHDYQRRHGGREPQPRKGASVGNGAIIRNPKTGQRMKLQNGQWVPIP